MSEKYNKKYKDRLFCLIFGNEKYKINLLSLYNAINNTDYADITSLEINTIDDVIYMKMKNDVSCIMSSTMSLFEQQSTLNPNMPFREFEYCAKLYDKYIEINKKDIYGNKLIKLPAPQCIVFYNGTDACEDKTILKLSDAFEQSVEGYEWTSIMYNINIPHNKEILDKCQALKEYSELVELIRKYRIDLNDMESAVDKAVNELIKNKGVLSNLLLAHKAEVRDMCITEYNEKLHEDTIKEEAQIETTINLLLEFNWTKEAILSKLTNKFKITEEEAEEYYEQYLKEH